MAFGLLCLTAFSLCATAVLWWSQRVHLRSAVPPAPDRFPPVSILKPLKGTDVDLESNLRTFFNLDYPRFEIVFAAEDPGDPALGPARKVAAEFPWIHSSFVTGAAPCGLNPKVNNLAPAARRARHDLILISDSNVAAEPDHLRHLVAHLQSPRAGLVSSPFRAVPSGGWGDALESLQLNTFVMGGVMAMHRLTDLPCVVGKSMFLRRSELHRMGGFEFLGGYLAEDQVCGEEIRAQGFDVRVASRPVTQVLGRRTVTEFIARHLRWARIRRHISPAGYAAEILLNPIWIAAIHIAVVQSAAAVGTGLAVLVAAACMSADIERKLGIQRRLAAYPVLELVRGLIVGAVWAVPFFSNSVTWRGNRFKIGPRTRLHPTLGQSSRALNAAAVSHPRR